MKALEILRAKKGNLSPVSPVAFLSPVTVQPLIDKAVTSVTAVTSEFNNVESEKHPLEIICYTPLGQPLPVMAQNADHAAWLVATNPKPSEESVREIQQENDFSELEDIVIVKVCNECGFFQPDKINPPAGMGRCELGINRKNKPLYPMQEACDKSKPLTPF